MHRVLEKKCSIQMAAKRIPCVVISRNLAPTARNDRESWRGMGFLSSAPSLASKAFTTEATVLLEERFAPRTTLHGTLLDIRGIGTLVREVTAVRGKVRPLLPCSERGHSLVADDLVRVKAYLVIIHLLGFVMI